MKAMYDLRPEKFSDNGNGSITYRWDIAEAQIIRQMGQEETEETKWQCNEVIVWKTVTRAKITTRVIEEIWGIDVEAKLLNDYNASVLGVLPIEYQSKYLAFINERKTIKDQINADCIEYEIA
jgi:hypothetical protein